MKIIKSSYSLNSYMNSGNKSLRRKEHYDQYTFFYAVADEDIEKPNESEKWIRGKSYVCHPFGDTSLFFINNINVRDTVKKGEIFICAHTNGIFGVEKRCNTMTFERIKKTHKRKDGLDVKKIQYFNMIQFKRERSVYNWFNKEMDSLLLKQKQIQKDLDENICYYNAPENKKLEYKIKLSSKRIKTKYGLENDLYKEDFNILTSPFDMAKERICKNEEDLKKWHFVNHDEVMSFEPIFPLYIIKGSRCNYVCEKKDLELIQDKNEKIVIDYINKWENQLITLSKKERSLRRWLATCLKNIHIDVRKKYPEYIDKKYSKKDVLKIDKVFKTT